MGESLFIFNIYELIYNNSDIMKGMTLSLSENGKTLSSKNMGQVRFSHESMRVKRCAFAKTTTIGS